jgi:leucyl aminopeptidase
MIQISSSKSKNPAAEAQTLVLVLRKLDKKQEVIGADKTISELINSAEESGLAFADFKKGVFFRSVSTNPIRNVLIVGVDEKFKTLENVRSLAATIHSCLKSNKIYSASLVFDGVAKGFKNSSDVAKAFTEGFYLAGYEFSKYISKKKTDGAKTDDKKKIHLELLLEKKQNAKTLSNDIDQASVLAECVNFARDLGNTPGNLMTPEILANEAVAAAKGTKLKVTVWDKARIKKENMGGLLSVSLGSDVDPRFIILEYNGGAKSKAPVCFVGKGLTFDSGGISIKPSGGMEEMKFDKCGGANVIATLVAIAKLKLKINVIGLVPATENMPGPLANKPGDIIVSRAGKTVEIDNTDAEGRLILMDALAYACEQKPVAIFDAATLTGACVVALGNSYTGSFTRDEKVRKKIDQATSLSGESVWHMPINDDHVADMKGTYADLNNISSFKGGGSSTAAAFLEQFVDKNIPWAHFDIAGTAWHTGNRLNYCPRKGATGVMVRTFVELAQLY